MDGQRGKCVVVGVAYDESMDMPLVLLRDDGDGRTVSIPVGAFEAGAIIMAAEGLVPDQPQAHDLMADLFKRHGFHLESLELGGGNLAGFYGRILYRKWIFRHRINVRPSDGIALALRLGAPIQIDSAMEEFAGLPDGNDPSAFFAQHEVLFLESQIPASCR